MFLIGSLLLFCAVAFVKISDNSHFMFQRNPNITLLGLPWGFPRWVAHGSSTPYANFSTTATYVVKWLLGAKKYHNLSIDYMGVSVQAVAINNQMSNPGVLEQWFPICGARTISEDLPRSTR